MAQQPASPPGSRLRAVVVAALDPAGLAEFWAGILGWDVTSGDTLIPRDDTGFAIRFTPTQEPKTAQNHVHLDLTSASADEQQRTVTRALALGGRHADVGQGPDVPHVVLADPEGNEFCVIEPGNRFLADCGFVGALACDGSQAVGYFWSAALGWPLVWDQDEETAIRSPHDGPKISWGGPPFAAPTGPARVRFELAPTAGADVGAEVDRLVSLGARRTDQPHVLTDPDGREFAITSR